MQCEIISIEHVHAFPKEVQHRAYLDVRAQDLRVVAILSFVTATLEKLPVPNT
jgi:hypothetical protein